MKDSSLDHLSSMRITGLPGSTSARRSSRLKTEGEIPGPSYRGHVAPFANQSSFATAPFESLPAAIAANRRGQASTVERPHHHRSTHLAPYSNSFQPNLSYTSQLFRHPGGISDHAQHDFDHSTHESLSADRYATGGPSLDLLSCQQPSQSPSNFSSSMSSPLPPIQSLITPLDETQSRASKRARISSSSVPHDPLNLLDEDLISDSRGKAKPAGSSTASTMTNARPSRTRRTSTVSSNSATSHLSSSNGSSSSSASTTISSFPVTDDGESFASRPLDYPTFVKVSAQRRASVNQKATEGIKVKSEEGGQQGGQDGDQASDSDSDAQPSASRGTKRDRSSNRSSTTPAPHALLTTKEKRTNHILSEQRRRDTVKESFSALTALLSLPPSYSVPLAPASANNTASKDKPTAREEPDKGKSTAAAKPKERNRRAPGPGRGPSKASALHRAVGLIRWLEEGNEYLTNEVSRLETASARV